MTITPKRTGAHAAAALLDKVDQLHRNDPRDWVTVSFWATPIGLWMSTHVYDVRLADGATVSVNDVKLLHVSSADLRRLADMLDAENAPAPTIPEARDEDEAGRGFPPP